MKTQNSKRTRLTGHYGIVCCLALGLGWIPHLTTAAPVILLDDTFDAENGGSGQTNFPTLTNWNIIDGSLDLLGNGFIDFYPVGGLYLDLDGTSGNAATMESKTEFSFVQDDIVTLSFDLAGPCDTISILCSGFRNLDNGNNSVTVSLGTLFQETFSLDFDEPFQSTGEFFATITRIIPVAASNDFRLRFEHVGGDDIGLILDNVRLGVESSAVVPEPKTIVLFITSVVGFGLILAGKRRKFRRVSR